MYEVMVAVRFCAANHVADYFYNGEPDRLHGHNFVAQAFVRTDAPLDATNSVLDVRQLQRAFQTIVDELHCTNLNTLPQFKYQSTSVENTSRYLYQQLKAIEPRLDRLVLYETPTQAMTYRECVYSL